MELDHDFTVPVPVDQAWSVLLDVDRVASCMPGATLDAVDGEEYKGRLKVKVGAMTITYRGTARITAADKAARTVTLEADGKEARGPGTATSTVVARLSDEGGTTRVTVHTKLNVTGRPAQFGRNILSEVGARLIARFAKALAAELETPSEPTAPERPAIAEATSGPAEEAAVAEPAPEPTPEPAPEHAAGSLAGRIPQQRPASAVESTSEPVPRPVRPRPARQDDEDDAIDFLEFAGPSIAKRAVPAAGAALALLLVIRFLVRRRKR